MEGDFFSKKGSFHFKNEAKLRKFLFRFLESAIHDLYFDEYLYKKNRLFEFDINDFTYSISLPPIALKPLDRRKHYHKSKFQKIESIQNYCDRNKIWFNTQIEEIISSYKKGKNILDEILLSKNGFENRKVRVLNEGLETIFDDKSAISLCEKLSTPFIRTLLKNPSSNLNAIHKICMKCFNKYGGHVVTFLLSLPKLNFGNYNSILLRNLNTYEGEIPSLKIKIIKNNIVYFMCFHEPKKRIGKESIVATLFNKTNRIIEGHLNYSGYLEYKIKSESLKINLFVDSIKNPSSIYCSVEQGRCINCNRDLTDIKSLRVGYGRDCAKELGIDYE